MKAKMKPHKLLSMLLALVMVVGLLPMGQVAYAYSEGDIAGTTGSGASEADPVVCDTFAEFKAAMENTEITYVKLTGAKGAMPKQESLAAAISNTTEKVLTIEGTNKFWSPLGGMNDCLIWPRGNLTINGNGTLEYDHGNSGGTGAVINMASNVSLTINENVTLVGGANGSTFGRALYLAGGSKTKILSGTFSGYSASSAYKTIDAVIVNDSAELTIEDGSFYATVYAAYADSKKTYGLINDSSSTKVTLNGGTYDGIDASDANCNLSDMLGTNCYYTDSNGTVDMTSVTNTTERLTVKTKRIDAVDVTITEPVAGAHPQNAVSNTADVSVSMTEWYHNGTKMSASDTFAAGETYKVYVIVYPDSGYEFADNPTVTFNGSKTGTLRTNGKDFINYYAEFTPENGIIDSVDVKITEPVAGAQPQNAVSNTANVSVSITEWYHNGTKMSASDTFAAGETYKVHVIVYPDSGYEFADNPTATFNGSKTGTLYLNGKDFINYYAEFTIPAASTEYTITVTDGKATVGAGTEISKAAEGTTVTLTANAAPADKVFDKWEVVSGSITLADANSATTTFTMPAGAVSVKATYKDKPVTTYTVSFDANGGTGSMAAATGVSGDYVLPVCGFTAPNGKQFKAWSVGGVEKAAGDTITVNANTTVTAIWENIPVTYYTVTFDSNGGSAVTAQSIEAGQKATKPADPTKDGYDFKGWTLNGSAYDFNTAVNGNITLVATWEQQQVVPTTYTVSFAANGGTGTMADVNGISGEYTLPENGFTAPDGKQFKAWSVDGVEKAAGDKITVTANTTVTAVWETIPAGHTHSYSSDWKSDSINHWHECSCGVKDDVAAHSFKWVIDKEATATKKGSKHEECKFCGYQRPAVEIPATGSTTKPTDPTESNPNTGALDDVPQTGDNSNMILWIVLLLASGLGVTGTIVYSKRKKYVK